MNHMKTSQFGVCSVLLLCLALQGAQATLIEKTDFSEMVGGFLVYWEKAYFRDLDIAGTGEEQIPFGIAHPDGYVAGGGTKYPLVLYLHGAGARGDNNAALQRETPRFFAESARAEPSLYNAFVLVPQVPSGSQWVNWPWGDGPYNQTDPGEPSPGFTPVSSITMSGNFLTSVTVGGYTLGVNDLATGTSSGVLWGPEPPEWPVENADNFDLLDLCASQYEPLDTVEFGGSLWSDTNGNYPDFFIFENGGTMDSGTVRAIFPDDSVGQPVAFTSEDWGDTGFVTNIASQPLTGMAFPITALLDASGVPLTNSSVIKGLRIESHDIDPFCICAVVPDDVYTLIASSTAGGSVTAPGEGSFDYGEITVVPLVAEADPDESFVVWTGTGVIAGKVADPNSASTSITMDADYTVHANFTGTGVGLSITVSGNDLTRISVDAYTVLVGDLCNGTTTGTYIGSGEPQWPIGSADNFDVLGSCHSLYDPTDTVLFGDRSLWWDTNGDNPDFFIFDNGPSPGDPRDAGTIQAVLADGSLGHPVSFGDDDWTDTGYVTNTFQASGRPLLGMSFAVTDLLDDTGAPLTNSSSIQGIRINCPTIDVTCICAVDRGGAATYTLTSSSTAGGSVTDPGEGDFHYDDGTVVPLVALADAGCSFVEWTGTGVDAGKVADPNSAGTSITMDAHYTVEANFEPRVASFTLIDADSDVPIPAFDPLPDGAVLDLAALPTRNLSIRANTAPSPVGSVRFGLDGDDNYQTENAVPYSMTGDSGGDYNPWTPSVGSHTVTATPYTESGGGGTAGGALSVTFEVIDGDGGGALFAASAAAAASSTYSEYMHLTENLLYFITDNSNDAILGSMLGIAADDIDLDRIYVVGDSMGAYGTWDILARQPALLAAGITSAGSGPKNKLAELLMSPIWAIHGSLDTTVPNYLPYPGDPDGAGSLGMLGLMDPTFDGVNSTAMIYVDDPDPGDDPTPDKRLVYTEFVGMGHNPPAAGWVAITSGTREWLFAQPYAGPGDVDGNGIVDGLDLAAVINAWGTMPGDPLWNPDADLNGTGLVDGIDLAEVISNWSTASAAAAPEPGASTEAVEEAVIPGDRRSHPGNVHRRPGNVRRR